MASWSCEDAASRSWRSAATDSLWLFVYPARPPEVEAAYRSFYLDSDIRQVRVLLSLIASMMFCLAVIDLVGFGITIGTILHTILVSLGIFIISTIHKHPTPRVLDWGLLTYVTAITIGVLVFYLTREVSGMRLVGVTMLLIFGSHMTLPTYALHIVPAVFVLLVGDAFILFTVSESELVANRLAILILILFAEIMAVMASAHIMRSRYQTFRAMRQIKTLSGMLPICSGCKKIRNDQGYYQQIEQYISEHSSAVFSHSICPDCVENLYPDLEKAKSDDG